MNPSTNQILITSARKGPCPMCFGKEQQVFVVRSAAFSGDICGPHLHVIAAQLQPEPAKSGGDRFNPDKPPAGNSAPVGSK